MLVAIAFLILGSGLAFSEDKKLEPTYNYSASGEQKIKLAESAAPVEVSSNATVYVLKRSSQPPALLWGQRLLLAFCEGFCKLAPGRSGLLLFDPHQHDTVRGYIRAEVAGKNTQVLFEPQIPNLGWPSDANLREVDTN